MLRSLFSGISGLRADQTMLDVVGNNIANVNTAGFKGGQVVFEDTLSQMLKAGGAPQNGNGGTNPAQVGLGVQVAAITNTFTQGAQQTTGRPTDLMIQGDGMFMVKNAGEVLYSRAGAFTLDASGRLTNPDGAVVQGWMANQSGTVNTNAATGDLLVTVGQTVPPQATSDSTLSGNLPAGATPFSAGPPATGTQLSTSISAYDGQGVQHTLSYVLSATATPNQWTMDVFIDGSASAAATSTVSFDPATGALTAPATSPSVTTPWGPVAVNLTGLTQYGGQASLQAVTPMTGGGSASGSLQSFTVTPDGSIVGVFSNGLKQTLGQVALATFANPPGLEKAGDSTYRATVNSGTPQVGTAQTGGRGQLTSGALEMSNVDLAQEFTELIIAQRGFQANSRVITTSDQVLQDLVDLKR
jgi:flagellar hook protein FlgE